VGLIRWQALPDVPFRSFITLVPAEVVLGRHSQCNKTRIRNDLRGTLTTPLTDGEEAARIPKQGHRWPTPGVAPLSWSLHCAACRPGSLLWRQIGGRCSTGAGTQRHNFEQFLTTWLLPSNTEALGQRTVSLQLSALQTQPCRSELNPSQSPHQLTVTGPQDAQLLSLDNSICSHPVSWAPGFRHFCPGQDGKAGVEDTWPRAQLRRSHSTI
jgi:hypothetical protein